MEEIKCKQVGQITAQGYTEMTGRVYAKQGLSPCIRTCGGGNTEVKILEEPIAYDEQVDTAIEPIVYDDYNGRIRADQCTDGALTTNCGNDAPRNGVKLIEPTERFFKQALDTAKRNECEVGDTIDAFNEKVNKSGISPTVTTRPEGFKTAILPIDQQYRVRKLTERECFKLMGVKQEDFSKIRKNQSKSSCYHCAGDSICCSVLMALFGQMLGIDYEKKIKEYLGELLNG